MFSIDFYASWALQRCECYIELPYYETVLSVY